MINTSQIIQGTEFKGQPSSGQFVTPRSSANVLFSSMPPFDNAKSELIHINFGQLLIVDAYQMPADKKIFLNRLIIGNRGVRPTLQKPGIDRDPAALNLSGTLMFWKRMDLNGADQWELSATKNMLFLTIPGVYQFELEDSSMVDDIYVEFFQHTVNDPIPKELWAGSL